MQRNDLQCPLPRCQEWGKTYNRGTVYEQSGEIRCEGCGAVYRDGKWLSVCSTCNKDVPQGELVGLFVPHNCKDCQTVLVAKQREAGQVCRMCRQVWAQCCC